MRKTTGWVGAVCTGSDTGCDAGCARSSGQKKQKSIRKNIQAAEKVVSELSSGTTFFISTALPASGQVIIV